MPEEVSKYRVFPYLIAQHQCLEFDSSVPSEEYEIEHVYGYRICDVNNNLHYTESGQAVYMTAALGIVMDPATLKQRVYGGK